MGRYGLLQHSCPSSRVRVRVRVWVGRTRTLTRPRTLTLPRYAFQLEALRCWHPLLFVAAQPPSHGAPPLADQHSAAAPLPELLLR